MGDASIKVLDCTLRDGGYCNGWKFGFDGAKRIAQGLVDAGIEIVELGFLSNRKDWPHDMTKFNAVEEASELMPSNKGKTTFVVMANYGEIDPDAMPAHAEGMSDGIRLAFHKKDRKDAIEVCRKLKSKGWKVFIQAMVSILYDDVEFLDMIADVNGLGPEAFYIVDSFGLMKRVDMLRFFYLIDNNLDPSIKLGFHSHNNMQLAFANAQTLIDLAPARGLIIDSSIFGMGRGAGNLCTELLIEHLNEEASGEYSLKPILELMDGVVGRFYDEQPWGYSLPNYLSAAHNTHPNYAGYFDSKKTLTVWDMDALFEMMDDSKRYSFDASYAEEVYLRYMETGRAQAGNFGEFEAAIAGKRVLLIAPGKSSVEFREDVTFAAHEPDTVVVSVNFEYPYASVDYVFVSNLRRFRDLSAEAKPKAIATSNIPADGVFLQVDYASLLNEIDGIRDNAGLMAIRFLLNHGVKSIALAGFDGYAYDTAENYGDGRMRLAMRKAVIDATNEGVSEVMGKYASEADIRFLTPSKYITIGGGV